MTPNPYATYDFWPPESKPYATHSFVPPDTKIVRYTRLLTIRHQNRTIHTTFNHQTPNPLYSTFILAKFISIQPKSTAATNPFINYKTKFIQLNSYSISINIYCHLNNFSITIQIHKYFFMLFQKQKLYKNKRKLLQ
jgi:hypothetical protein